MRTKEELLKLVKKLDWHDPQHTVMFLQDVSTELLIDIRELLLEQKELQPVRRPIT